MRMYRGDLKPDLVLDLTDAGAVVDLTVASSIKVIGSLDGTVIFNRAPTSATALGVVTMLWQAGDTSAVGTLTVEVEVTWSGAKPQTFRASNQVLILPDLA